MKMKKSLIICSLVLCFAFALSLMSMGLAAWQTTITSSGNVSASGKWDVTITNASLNLSTGTAATNEVTTYELQRTGVKSDALIAAVIGATTHVDDFDLVGTQSDEDLSFVTRYYAVDTTKYDISDINTWAKEDFNTIVADESTVTISDHLKAYIGNYDGSPKPELSVIQAKMVDGLLRDTTALVKELYPDTWQNYVLCYLSPSSSAKLSFNFTIASMAEKTETVPAGEDTLAALSADNTSVNFADVTFGLPGAWAQYTITVTNNGTVDANLANAVIELDTESDQLVLDKPDLSDEVLQPGESCTITFVVKVPDTVTGDLDATGTLTVRLPYIQTAVEPAPEAGHSHG